MRSFTRTSTFVFGFLSLTISTGVWGAETGVKPQFAVASGDKAFIIGRSSKNSDANRPYTLFNLHFGSSGVPQVMSVMDAFPGKPSNQYNYVQSGSAGSVVQADSTTNEPFKALFNTGASASISVSGTCQVDFTNAYVNHASAYCQVGSCNVYAAAMSGGTCPSPFWGANQQTHVNVGSGTTNICIFATNWGSGVGDIALQTVSQAYATVTYTPGMPGTCVLNGYTNNI